MKNFLSFLTLFIALLITGSSMAADTVAKINFSQRDGDHEQEGWISVYGTESTWPIDLGNGLTLVKVDGLYPHFGDAYMDDIGADIEGFPANVQNSANYLANTDEAYTLGFTVTGLDPAETYKFDIYSRAWGTSEKISKFSIGDDDTISINSSQNEEVIHFEGLQPNTSGEITLSITKLPGGYAFINGWIITKESASVPVTDEPEEYYSLDETSGQAIDSQGNNNSIDVMATQGVEGVSGTCYLFNGTTDKVTFADSENWSVTTTDDLSVSAWVNLTADNISGWATVWGNESDICFDLKKTNDSGMYYLVWYSGGSPAYSDIVDLGIGKWNHLAMVKEADQLVSFYLNGELVSSTTPDDVDADPAVVFIGGDESEEDINGKIDEVGIWKRVLTADEIAEMYEENKPVSTDPEEFYSLDETSGQAIDSQGNNNSIDVQATQGVEGVSGTCYQFNGTTDKVTFPDSDNWSVATTDDLSVSAWVNLTADNFSGWATIWGNESDICFDLKKTNDSGMYYLVWYSGGSPAYSDIVDLGIGKWNHLAMVKEADQLVSFYLNGELVSSTTPDDVDADPAVVFIGGDESEEDIYGKIDEVGIWKRVLTADEIAEMYEENKPASTASGDNDTVAKINFSQRDGDYEQEGWTSVYGTESTWPIDLGNGLTLVKIDGLYPHMGDAYLDDYGIEVDNFPLNVVTSCNYLATVQEAYTLGFQVTGLDPAATYKFDVFSLGWGTDGEKIAKFSVVEGDTITINAVQNEEVIHFENLQPNAAGEITLSMTKVPGEVYAMINGWIITKQSGGGTKVKEVNLSNINLYPNPANDYVTIKNLSGNSIISVFNIAGKKMLEQTNGLDSEIRMDTKAFKNGIYLFRIINANNAVQTFKVIKK